MNFGTLSTPSITPAGGTYNGHVTVSIAADEGSTVRYTIDNTEPTAASPVYTGGFVVDRNATVRAKAFKTDYLPSPTAAVTYSVIVPTPTLSLSSGTFAPGTTVTINHPDQSAVIRITLDGTTPTISHPAVAAGTSLLVGNFTLKARAFKESAVDSSTESAMYVLTKALSGGALALGTSHGVAATPDGLLYGWGGNDAGQVGDGTTSTRNVPTVIHALSGVVSVSAGAKQTFAVTLDGRIFAWGENSDGRLGDGTTIDRPIPVQLALSGIVSVASGHDHALALTSDGRVYAWGAGTDGALGLGSTTSASTPTLIPSLSSVIAVAAGGSHSLALTQDGRIHAWGANASGQIGDGTTATRTSPVLLSELADVGSLFAGASHSGAVSNSGEVFVWGRGLEGQLGLGTEVDTPSPSRVDGLALDEIVGGASHSIGRSSAGAVTAWGGNSSGQIGDGTFLTRASPVTIASPGHAAWAAAGGQHSAVVTSDGHLWTWGANEASQLADGTVVDRAVPQDVYQFGNVWGRTAPPILSIPSGTYGTAQSVVVSNTASDVVMRYTLDGSTPSEDDPIIAAGGVIAVDHSLALRVRAWSDTLPPSRIRSASYTLRPSPPAISPTDGTHTTSQTVTITSSSQGTTVHYTLDGTEPSESSATYEAPFVIATTTTVKGRAFRTGWMPSLSTTSVLSFQYRRTAGASGKSRAGHVRT